MIRSSITIAFVALLALAAAAPGTYSISCSLGLESNSQRLVQPRSEMEITTSPECEKIRSKLKPLTLVARPLTRSTARRSERVKNVSGPTPGSDQHEPLDDDLIFALGCVF
ncbi:uncharacterized protein EI97DRAFT_281855 [Westerdykella ornata]|uniref:Uncharacterized protein n=1 Tax=Westerdykella ornata TaxID=318751 RepID=A0A6A6JPG2_WESOR|nr:uncharacterized protein EI97DRAFT_281855 [Westerdykella ornata]KAF2278033.1 hypothetical protein EI97DRAFT_281855 [Westerdykella ornata]